MLKRKQVAIVLWALLGTVLLWRSFMGVNWSDETFYIATLNRFFLGDTPFLHEWKAVQLSTLLMYPLFCLYKAFQPQSNDGVMLFFRLVYWVMSAGIAWCVYCNVTTVFEKLNVRGKQFAALLTAAVPMLYVRGNISAPSYNSIGVSAFYLAETVVAKVILNPDNDIRKEMFVVGVLLSVAVVCNPYLALLYIAVLIVTIVQALRKEGRVWIKAFIWLSIGVIVAASVYCTQLFLLVSPQNVLSSIPYLLSDPDYASKKGILYEVLRFVGHFVRLALPTLPISVALITYAFVMQLKQNHTFPKERIAATGVTLCIVQLAIDMFVGYGSSFVFGKAAGALATLAFLLLVIYWDRFLCKVLLYLFVPAGIFAFVANMASNVGANAVAMGTITFCVPSLLIIGYVAPKLNRVLRTGLMLCGILFLIQLFLVRVFVVSRDAPLTELTAQITNGPAAGLYTTPEHKEQYETFVADVETMNQMGLQGTIVFNGLSSMGYLVSEQNCGTYTTFVLNSYGQQKEIYWKEHPEKIPTAFFDMAAEIGKWEDSGAGANPTPNLPMAGDEDVKEWLEQHGYEEVVFDSGVLYYKR